MTPTLKQLQLHLVLITIALLVQMSYSIHLATQLRGEASSERTEIRPGSGGSCALSVPEEKKPIQFDLTGSWMTNDHALVTVEQDKNQVTWKAISSYDNGRTFTHTFCGELDGDILRGSFYDHAPGKNRNSGNLVFQVIDQNLFVLKSSTGAFGARKFTKKSEWRIPRFHSNYVVNTRYSDLQSLTSFSVDSDPS